MAKAAAATRTAPNTLPPQTLPALGSFGLPENSPALQGLAGYQNAYQGILNSANQQANQGFTQNHPILSGVLSGLVGGLVAGPAGLVAGPMLTQLGNKNRKSAIYGAAQDQIDSLTSQYDKVINPLAQMGIATQAAPMTNQSLMDANRGQADYASGNAILGRNPLAGITQQSPSTQPALAPMDYTSNYSMDLPSPNESGTAPLQANASTIVPPQMMEMYQPQSNPLDGLSGITWTPEMLDKFQGRMVDSMNHGGTLGINIAKTPGDIAQSYGAANASNAQAYYDTEQGKVVFPKAQAWIRNENAGTGLKQAQTQQTNVETQWIPQKSQAQINNWNRPPAGATPNPLTALSQTQGIQNKQLDALYGLGVSKGFIDPVTKQWKPPAPTGGFLGIGATPQSQTEYNALKGQYDTLQSQLAGYQPPAPASNGSAGPTQLPDGTYRLSSGQIYNPKKKGQ